MTNSVFKKILITGAGSYIGSAVEVRLNNAGHKVTVLDMIGDNWRNFDFSGYDSIFHVAGIAHDTGKKRDKELYYKVNRDLAVETAEKAQASGVKQFIFMSSMLVYNGVKDRNITAQTQPKIKGCYGDSKLQADLALQKMNSENFKVAIIRPPMIFGKDCKGNFPRLAMKTPVFPKIKNKRSMLHIDNLCEFIKLVIENNSSGIFFPQNPDYFCTSELVKEIAIIKRKKLWLTCLFNWAVWILYPFSSSLKKLFGNLTYDKELSKTFDRRYQIISNEESLNKSIKENA